jgi:hypothetical protein
MCFEASHAQRYALFPGSGDRIYVGIISVPGSLCFTLAYVSTDCTNGPGCPTNGSVTVGLRVLSSGTMQPVGSDPCSTCPPTIYDFSLDGVSPPSCGVDGDVVISPNTSTTICVNPNDPPGCGQTVGVTIEICCVCDGPTNDCEILPSIGSGSGSAGTSFTESENNLIVPESANYLIPAGTQVTFGVSESCGTDAGNLAVSGTAAYGSEWTWDSSSSVRGTPCACTVGFPINSSEAEGVIDTSLHLLGEPSAEIVVQPYYGVCSLPCCEVPNNLTITIVDTNLFRSSITASPACENGIVLSWLGDPENAAIINYQLYRSTVSGGPYSLIDTTTNTDYTDAGLVSGTTYYYVVEALYGPSTPVLEATSIEVNATVGPVQTIYNLQFGYPLDEIIHKKGMAAVGNTLNDFWNVAGADPDRDGDPPSSFGTTCLDSCSNASDVSVSASCGDDMVGTGFDREEFTNPLFDGAAITAGGLPYYLSLNLPAGTYDAYLYSVTPYSGGSRMPSTFTLVSGPDNLSDYSPQTPSSSDYNVNNYVLGNQYVLFSGMSLSSPGVVVFQVYSEYEPFCNGLQIVVH